jgi:hypothetical protein
MAKRIATIKLGPRDAAIVVRDDEGPEIILPGGPGDAPASHATIAVAAIVSHSLPSMKRLSEVVGEYLDGLEINKLMGGRPLSRGSKASN